MLSERPAATFWMSITMQVECRFGDMFGVKWTVQTHFLFLPSRFLGAMWKWN
jgi:hypothetical protein